MNCQKETIEIRSGSAYQVILILLILLAGCDHHRMPSDVRKSLNLAGGNKNICLKLDSVSGKSPIQLVKGRHLVVNMLQK